MFIDEMRQTPAATLQQVAFVRSLARKYRVEPKIKKPNSQRVYGDDY